MMRTRQKLQRGLYNLADKFTFFQDYFTGILGFFAVLDLSQQSWLTNIDWLYEDALFFQNTGMFWLFIVYIFVALIMHQIKKMTSPRQWDYIQFILDKFHEKYFADSDDKDRNRVTLFKREKYCVFTKHWSATGRIFGRGDAGLFPHLLVPVLRSGHMRKKSFAAFKVGDADEDCEGIAGMAYAKDSPVCIENLPEVRRPGTSDDSKLAFSTAKQQYSNQAMISEKMIDKYAKNGKDKGSKANTSLILPRSIAATPIEVGGKIWGVLVIDSADPGRINQNTINDYKVVIAIVGRLLEKNK